MKLIDMLVEDGLNGWQWPDGVECITQDNGSSIYKGVAFGYHKAPYLKKNIWLANNGTGHADAKIKKYDVVADDWDTAIITREQYEAALAAKNDGWIEWGGGECPVKEGTLIDVRYRDSDDYPDALGVQALSGNGAGSAYWEHDGYSNDIIAYRLHQPQEAAQPKADDETDLNECIGQGAAPVWNGEGLPPVGMEIEYSFAKVNYRTDFSRGKVLAYGMQSVFMEHWASKNEFIQPLDKIEFRPIRSEADRKRDAAVQALCDAGGGGGKVDEKEGYGSCWFDVYDAIAAGKIPGVKLEM
nr:MAG TPA: hypothetical protein [Caudoviricetes sp.]